MQAYASAQLTPLESESLDTPVPSIKPASAIEVGGVAEAQLNSAANPIAALTSLVLDGLTDRDLGVLARRLLPHLRQPADDDRLARAAYTVASLAAELGISQKAIRSAISRHELSAVKRGTRWLISADAVREWVSPAEQRTSRQRTRLAAAPRAAGPSLRSVLCAAASSGRRR
jgi:excisionase family DNA binding protein